MKFSRLLVSFLVAGSFALPAAAETQLQKLSVSVVDHDAVRHATATRHALRAHTAKGPNLQYTLSKSQAAAIGHATQGASIHPRTYPGDLSYNGGATVPFAESHAVFVTGSSACATPACWGNPLQFLTDYGASQFSDITNQYVGTNAPDRYTVGTSFLLNLPVGAPLTDADMQAIAHAAAATGGFSGYNHIVHIFLSPGQDLCFDSTDTVCYSPDNPATYYFCAYHGSVTFSDVGHVLYSAEPYQNVPGCQVFPGTPNGQVADSTNNVLSHELTETITDPDGTAWINTLDLPMLYEEIGDECELVSLYYGTFDPAIVSLNHHWYAIQPEYSNSAHACATGP